MMGYNLDRRTFLKTASAASIGCVAATKSASAFDDAPEPDEYESILNQMEGNGSEDDPYTVTTVIELQAMDGDLEGHYELGNDIDASDTRVWNDGKGFDPIGERLSEDRMTPFTGDFYGEGYSVTDLYINREEDSLVGLFGVLEDSNVRNISLEDVDITGKSRVGSLCGMLKSDVSGLFISGDVSGVFDERTGPDEPPGNSVGGLAGKSRGAVIFNSESCVSVSGKKWVGGLTGGAEMGIPDDEEEDDLIPMEIIESTVDGEVNGRWEVGGLIGYNRGEIDDSISNSIVTAEEDVGGIVGANWGLITNSNGETVVTGDANVGGFIGSNIERVKNSTATSDVAGSEKVGGFIGNNRGQVVDSTVTGEVDGEEVAGGLVGWNVEDIMSSSADVDVASEETAGGLVGVNANGNVENSDANGSVTGNEVTGGLVGDLRKGVVQQSSATSEVTDSADSDSVGGLIGHMGAGLKYFDGEAVLRSSEWDTNATGQPDAVGSLEKDIQGTIEIENVVSEDGSEYEHETSDGIPGFSILAGLAGLGGGLALIRKLPPERDV